MHTTDVTTVLGEMTRDAGHIRPGGARGSIRCLLVNADDLLCPPARCGPRYSSQTKNFLNLRLNCHHRDAYSFEPIVMPCLPPTLIPQPCGPVLLTRALCVFMPCATIPGLICS